MFKKSIEATAFTTKEAEYYCSNTIIQKKISLSFDESFISSLRALLYNRIPNGAYMDFCYVDSAEVSSLFNSYLTDKLYLIICKTPGEMDRITAMLKHEFVENEKVHLFFKKTTNVRCFINMNQRVSIVIAENLNNSLFHYLQCAIPAFLPWYFNGEQKITEDEFELLESLKRTNSRNYLNVLDKIAKKIDFRSEFIKKNLKGIENILEERRIVSITKTIEKSEENINTYTNYISTEIEKIHDLEIEMLGLKEKINQHTQSEIMDYFLCNKSLSMSSMEGNILTFVVHSYCEYYDEDMITTLLDNPDSYIYNRNSRIPPNDIKLLMESIFIDQKIKLRFCAAYQINLSGACEGVRDFNYDKILGNNTYMPNPHINRYNCLGNYRPEISDLLRKYDYVGVIELCIASCKSLNFGDSVVIEQFMLDMCGVNDVNNRCLELPDGSVVNPKEAIKWLKSQNEKTEVTINE